MERLTKEEVLHVANLARIDVSDEEIEKYSVELKELINEIDKIKDVEVLDNDILVTPVEYNSRIREDIEGNTKTFDEIKKNIPKSVGNFVEVPVMINE